MNKKRFYPFDIVILGYMLILSFIILLFGKPIHLYYDELLMNLGVIVLVLLVVRYLGRSDNRLILFFRLLYPAALFTLFYEQTAGLMRLFFPNFLDYQLVAFENALFGVNPIMWLDKNLINVWLTEVLSLTYFAYYPMIPVFLICMFWAKRYDVIKSAVTAICLTFFLSYFIFFMYPIEGPRYYFAAQYVNSISGPIFRPMVEFMQKMGSVHGGCLPSTHFAISLVILIFCLKYFRRAGILLIPIVAGLAMGTVYGRYHYISDLPAGAIVAISMTWLTMKYLNKHMGATGNKIKTEEKMSYVS